MNSCNRFNLMKPAEVIGGSAAEIIVGRETAGATSDSKTSVTTVLAG